MSLIGSWCRWHRTVPRGEERYITRLWSWIEQASRTPQPQWNWWEMGAQHYCICSCTSTHLYFIWWSMNLLLHYHIYHMLLCMQCPLPDLTKSLWLTSSFYVVCLYFKLFQQEMKVIWGTTNFWPRSVHRGPAYPSLGVGFLWDIGGAHSPLIYLNYLNCSLFLNQLNYL